jgi:surfactin synthase thioesterase subunit
VPVGPGAEGATRLYVVPHVGAGPGALATLAEELPDTVALWALNLPGRQARLTEPPVTALEPLVAELVDEVAAADVPHALFGYCAGALLAHLVARRTRPSRLFVGSYPAPDVALVPRRLHTLPSDAFWATVLADGGVPPELATSELRPVFEPAIRADFALYAGFHHHPADPLDVPITVLFGRDDPDVTRGGLLGWRRQSTGKPELREFTAGHWLVDEVPAALARCIAERIGGDGG